MTVELVQKFCLSFAHATENLQWGDAVCFKIRGKLFAVLNLGLVPPHLLFKCTPETFVELTEREGITAAPYLGRYNWVSLEGMEAVPWRELQELLKESYAMVAAKAKVGRINKKKRRTLVRTVRKER